MNAAHANAIVSNANTLDNAKVVESSSQVPAGEGDRPAGKRRESLLDILMRALSAVAF